MRKKNNKNNKNKKNDKNDKNGSFGNEKKNNEINKLIEGVMNVNLADHKESGNSDGTEMKGTENETKTKQYPDDYFANQLTEIKNNRRTRILTALYSNDIEDEEDLIMVVKSDNFQERVNHFRTNYGMKPDDAKCLANAINYSEPQESLLPPPPSSLPPPPPKEIKPQSINGEYLYERKEAAIAIYETLRNPLGTRKTPICDNCFGAGKTSIAYKFRDVLNSLPPNEWSWPVGSESLQNAVYVHVPLNYESKMSNDMNWNNPDSIDIMLVHELNIVFRQSLHHQTIDCSSRNSFIQSVDTLAGDVKFLVHFDEVGVFETSNESYSKNVLYRILHFGETFRKFNHYYLVTGRSRYLHTVGLNNSNNSSPFSSPTSVVLIPLPPLTISSVIEMFKEHKAKLPMHLFDENGEPAQNIVNHIYQFSGGVPRAVYAALICYKQNHNSTFEQVNNAVIRECGKLTLLPNDQTIFEFCVELSWSQIKLSNTTRICNEEITDVIARLGIYRDNISNESFTLHVPAYLATRILSPQLMNICLIPNKGDRFELAFRRLFHMRCNLTSNNWNQLGLSFLDNCDIPFPPQHFNESLPFPKISDNGSRDQEIAQNCLRDINNGVSISNSQFHPDCIVTLCSEMQIGRYYQPFEMSKSAMQW